MLETTELSCETIHIMFRFNYLQHGIYYHEELAKNSLLKLRLSDPLSGTKEKFPHLTFEVFVNNTNLTFLRFLCKTGIKVS